MIIMRKEGVGGGTGSRREVWKGMRFAARGGRKVLLSAMSDERASQLAWFASPTTACMIKVVAATSPDSA